MKRFFVCLSLVSSLLFLFAQSASAATLNVPGGYATIQAAVDAAAPTGDLVLVAAGTYNEQVVVSGKDLTIQGAGAGATFVTAPAALAIVFTTGGPNRPVISAVGSGDVRIEDLSVDGLGLGNANNRIVGIGYYDAGGRILNVDITGTRNTPMDGAQAGVGILADNGTGGPYALEVGNVAITDFQKNGMVLAGAGLTVDVHDCDVTGSGDVSFIAQNGIQLSYGAGGGITDCRVADMRYTPASYVASGILVYQSGGAVAVAGSNGPNAIADVQAPVSWIDGNGTIDGIEVAGTIVAGQDFGPIFIGNYSAALAAAPDGGPRVISPFGRDIDGGAGAVPNSPSYVAYSVAVTNSCLAGADVAGTVGVYAYSAGGAMSVSVSNCAISDWDAALLADGGATSLTANNNSITSNMSAGYDNTLGAATQNAEFNWWGAGNGPTPPGGGEAILGAGVDVTPWLSNANDADPGCRFLPAGDNTIAPVPPATCLSILNTCLAVPVTITRTDALPMRGFSVQVALSPELDLCAGPSSIVEGTYLTPGGMTTFQVISNGGGIYTVDGAILGASGCITAAAGTLFTVNVKRTVANGTGTVTITPIKARDCVNGPIPVSPGAAASITIDTTPPTAVANLAATQVKVGNDADGTTKINLTFTAPGDAAVVQVYRAGFGSYPEYDDDAGVVPATPSYPPGGPWVLTAVTASGQSDEVTARDFWYYVVFTKDACGNVSAVSNKTTGTLNYHLGDVHNGISDCAGNNLVNTGDISFLGAHYGISVPLYGTYSCLDVGPTTDFSVNARPTTDSVVDFEDLIMFAINFGTVGKAGRPDVDAASGGNVVSLDVREIAAQFDVAVRFTGGGDVQGMSLDLAYDPTIVEAIATSAGELLERQSRGSTVLSSRPGNVDLSLLGTGRGISGAGDVAHVTFRRLRDGEPGIAIRGVKARDQENRPVDVAVGSGPILDSRPPAINFLAANYPNPFQQSTIIPFGVRVSGPVSLSIFDVQGRRVRDLIQGTQAAGKRTASWDGRDTGGNSVPSGVYMVRLQVGSDVITRTLRLVK